ncbi:hypothetical protein [Neptunitalea lumnitzerae]|uniref:Uncharacterized protein n=1 Tax=Neptunitalea lumnitzerae TaxID=2965509 RepID=A0ABQ5MK97_9FLAO|nr:hypothetical protein [Neptunitalea sp. Y10]GLB49836.1 hypothetical protein Y10_22040 [Neptunitalea sp. Y10]
MKRKFYVIDKDNTILKQITDNEKTQLDKAINEISENNMRNWGFIFINQNYRSLFIESNKLFSKLSKTHVNSFEEMEEATKLLNYHFFNYLSSINTFIDHTTKFITNRYKEKKEVITEFKKLTNRIYDSHFEYRLLYSLRNYTLHAGYSICTIIVKHNEKQVSYIPCINKSSLLEKGKKSFNAILKKDFELQPQQIPIFELIKKSINHYKEINNFIEELIKDSNIENKRTLREIYGIKTNESIIKSFMIDNGNEKLVFAIPYQYL